MAKGDRIVEAEPREKAAIRGADDTNLLGQLEKSPAAGVDTKIVQGDITRLAKPVDAIITPINSGGMWWGGIDGAIQRVAGEQFHGQAMAKLDKSGLTEGEALHATQKGQHKGGFKDVVFVVDDLGKPIRDVVFAGLMKAEEAGLKSVAVPATMRMGVMKGVVEKTGTEVADEIAKGVEKFLSTKPQNVKDIQFIVYNGSGSDASDNREVTNRLGTKLEAMKSADPAAVLKEAGIAPEMKVDKAAVDQAMEKLKAGRTEPVELKAAEPQVKGADKAEARVAVNSLEKGWGYDLFKNAERGVSGMPIVQMPDGSVRMESAPGHIDRTFEAAAIEARDKAVSFQFNYDQYDIKPGTTMQDMKNAFDAKVQADREAWLKSPAAEREREKLRQEAVTYGRQESMDRVVVGLPDAIDKAKSGQTAPLLKLLGEMEQLDGNRSGLSVLNYDKKAIGQALLDAGFKDPGTIRMFEAARGNMQLKGELIVAMAAENLLADKQIKPEVGAMARNHQYEVEAQAKMKAGAQPNGVLEEKARRELVVKAEQVGENLVLDRNTTWDTILDSYKQTGSMSIGNLNVGEKELSAWRQEGKVPTELVEQVKVEAEKLEKLAAEASSGAERIEISKQAALMREAYADMTGPEAKAAQMRFINGLETTNELMTWAAERRESARAAWQEEQRLQQRRERLKSIAVPGGIIVGLSIVGAAVYSMYKSDATRRSEFQHAPIGR